MFLVVVYTMCYILPVLPNISYVYIYSKVPSIELSFNETILWSWCLRDWKTEYSICIPFSMAETFLLELITHPPPCAHMLQWCFPPSRTSIINQKTEYNLVFVQSCSPFLFFYAATQLCNNSANAWGIQKLIFKRAIFWDGEIIAFVYI